MKTIKGKVLGKTILVDWSTGRAVDRTYFEAIDGEGRRYMFPFSEYASILSIDDEIEIEFVVGSNGSRYVPAKVHKPPCDPFEDVECAGCHKTIPADGAYFNSDREPICIDCHDLTVMAAEALSEGDR